MQLKKIEIEFRDKQYIVFMCNKEGYGVYSIFTTKVGLLEFLRSEIPTFS